MGAFLDYHNKRNKTSNTVIAPTNSNNTSSFLAYHKKREEERKKQEALRKAQEEAKSTSKKMSGLKAEALRKQYGDKLSEINDIKLPKATDSNIEDKIINDTPLKDSAYNKTKSQIEAEPVRLNSYKPKETPWYEKVINGTLGIGGNFLMGIEGTMPKTTNFITEGKGYLTKKATGFVLDKTLDVVAPSKTESEKEFKKALAGVANDVAYNKISETDPLTQTNEKMNSEEMQKWRNETIENNTEKAKELGAIGGFVNDVALGVGQNVVPAAISFVPGAQPLSAGLFMTSAGGSYLEDAEQRGMNEDEKMGYATTMGIFEGGFDWVTMGFANKALKLAGTGEILTKQGLKNTAFSTVMNGLQEGLTEPANEYTASLFSSNNTLEERVKGQGQYADWDNMGSRMLRSASIGMISGLIFDGAGKGIGSAIYTSNVNQNTQQVINKTEEQLGRKLTTEETAQIQEQVKQHVKAKMIDTTDLTTEEKAEVEKLSNMSIEDMMLSTVESVVNSGKVDVEGIAKGVNEALKSQNMTQIANMQDDTNSIENSFQSLYNNERGSDLDDRIRNGITNEGNIQESEQQNSNRGGSEGSTTVELDTSTEKLTNYQEKLDIINKAKNNIQKVRASQNMLDVYNDLGINLYGYNDNETNHDGLTYNGEVFINNVSNNSREIIGAHELIHALRQNRNEVYNSEIQPIINDVANNDEYRYTLVEYLKDNELAEGYLDDKYINLLAEEVIGNVSAEILSGYEKNYYIGEEHKSNLENTLMKITKGRKFINDNENSNRSSFSMQQNKIIAPPPVQQNTQQTENKKVVAPLPKNYSQVNEQSKIKGNDKTAEILGQLSTDKMTLKENKDFLIQKLVNKGHYIDQLAKITKNKELTYKYDRMLGASSEGQYEVGVAQTDNKGNKIGKSINDIWKPAEDSKTVAEFSDYLLHKHNIDRMKQGKPVFGEAITAETSKQMVENYEKLYPEFKEWSKDIYNFNKNQLRNTTEAGLTSEELETLLDNMYGSYVTISRDKNSNFTDKKSKVIAPNKTVKKAVGGNSNIQPLKDAMAKQAIAVKQAIRRNDLGLELMNTLKTAENVETYDINNLLSQDKSGSYLLVFDKGQAKKLKITQGIYESLKPSQKHKLENTIPLKAVQKASSIQRSLLTVDNPIFMITNFFKDFQDGMFNSKYTSKFMKNYGRALVEIKNNGKYYNEYMANGGNSNTYFDYEKGVKKDTKVSKFIDKIRAGNEVIEMAPRLAEYISTREAGGNVNEALYNAAEITTNFKRGGEFAKAINRNGANFLNASIQGLSKQIRNISGQNGLKGYVNLLSKATLLSVAPAILNHLLLGDDEEYQDLPDYVKDTYYLFKIGDNKFLRIPKGRVLSIFGSAARRTLEYAEGNEEAFKGFGDTVLNQMAPNNPLSDNIFAPIVQASKNETWYGGDLVPTRLQDELPENQYDESTDSFSKWLGKLTGISPMKINYVIDQYSGGLGDILLPMMTPQAENNVLTDKFTIDSVLKNKNVSKFYETLEKQTQISNSPEATDEDMLKTKYLNGVQSSVSDLYKEKREIQLSDLSNKEKKEEVKEIQEKINEILEEGLRKYDKGKVYSNYATIGNEQYYKATNLKSGTKEWKKLSEEETEKNKNISLKTYSDYKEKVAKETISQRKSGTIKEEGSLKSKDKIQILLDSNYANEEKTELYENYILNESNKKYPIIKQTGIDINEYMKYEQQEFKADKKDDGTVDGKSISGSKKQKVKSYIENMNITYTQKLVLYGLEYTPSDSDKTKIVNYVKSMPDKTNKEKLEMLDQFEWVTIYKNGGFKY